jgi:hypothetical protein
MEDDPDSDLRQQLELTGVSYADWERESQELRSAADGSARGGFVDGAHLTRAGEIVSSIKEELAMLNEVGQTITSQEVAGQVEGIRSRLVALRDEIRQAARKMHGLT